MHTVLHLLRHAAVQFLTLVAALALFAPVSAAVAAPMIRIVGSDNVTAIANGDTTPQAADGTDFGGTPVGQGIKHTFYLVNDGDGLTLTGVPDAVALSGPGAAAFTVTSLEFPGYIPGNALSRLVIQFLPPAGGTYHATVTILSDAPVNGTYTF